MLVFIIVIQDKATSQTYIDKVFSNRKKAEDYINARNEADRYKQYSIDIKEVI